MGSKSKIAKYIVPIIQEFIDDNGIKIYIDTHCGGCNIADKVRCDIKIASDNNKYLIALLQNIDKVGELPDFITKERYVDVRSCLNKSNNKYPDWYIGAVGFLASYNGRFFDGGYAGLIKTKINTIRNYYDEAKRNLVEQIPHLDGIVFRHCDYTDYRPEDYKGCLFYCDPPYRGTKQYGTSRNFDYDKFWSWAERMSENNIVLVSEHQAPNGWKCVWEHEVKRTIDNAKSVKAVERLFIYGKSSFEYGRNCRNLRLWR